MKSLQLFIISFLFLTLTKSDPDPLDTINLNINIPYENPDGIEGSKRKEISDYRGMVFDYGNNGNNNRYIKRRFKDIGYENGKYRKYTKYGRYNRYGRYGRKATTPPPTTDPAHTASQAPTTNPTSDTAEQRVAVRRVAGGTETEVNKYPWIVLLLQFRFPLCGGSLIADNWILTAAHCYMNYPNPDPKNFPVVIGEHDRSTRAETSLTKRLSINKIIIHPQYDRRTSFKDIALLRLSNPVDLNVYTPVCLPRPGDEFTGKKAWVYGWGNTRGEDSKSDVLLDLEVTVVPDASAKQAYESIPGRPRKLPAKQLAVMVFAGGEAGKDACLGDSGGPLSLSNMNGKHTQIGIVSWGAKGKCGKTGLPTAYTEVSALRRWIDLQIRRNGGGFSNC